MVNKNGSALAEMIEKVENILHLQLPKVMVGNREGAGRGAVRDAERELGEEPIRRTLRPSRGERMTHCAYPKKA